VAGGAATLVDPLDAGSIASGIERLLDDPALAESQRRKGLDRSRQYDWDKAAALTLQFYRRVLG
jgi:glycosyltransferase involved in cell wall biosynthesis